MMGMQAGGMGAPIGMVMARQQQQQSMFQQRTDQAFAGFGQIK
jgi:hypothetical protein